MPRALVTQALVCEAADALVASGAEPTIITVQERIGGGSYTTVKRYLEAWKAQQHATQHPVVAIPEAIAAKGSEFVRSLWIAATARADAGVAQAREEAQQQVEVVRAALTTAEAAILRLEAESEEQAQQVAGQEQTITQLHAEGDQAQRTVQIAEARASEQAQRVGDLQRELDRAHQQVAGLHEELAQARAAVLDQARLSGELAALKQQLQDQAALIERLTAHRAGS